MFLRKLDELEDHLYYACLYLVTQTLVPPPFSLFIFILTERI